MSLLARNRFVIVIALFVAALGLALSQSSAQKDESTTPDDGDKQETVPVTRRAQLSGPEQIEAATAIITRGTQLSTRVMSMLDEARRESDIMRVTCLDHALTQVNAHNSTLERRQGDLASAVSTSDDERRNHEFTVISVIGQNLSSLERAASECTGQDMFETGHTRVVTTIEPGTTTANAAVLPEIPVPTSPSVPPPASL